MQCINSCSDSSLFIHVRFTSTTGWAKTQITSRSFQVPHTMFSPLSRVPLMFWMLPHLNTFCTNLSLHYLTDAVHVSLKIHNPCTVRQNSTCPLSAIIIMTTAFSSWSIITLLYPISPSRVTTAHQCLRSHDHTQPPKLSNSLDWRLH